MQQGEPGIGARGPAWRGLREILRCQMRPRPGAHHGASIIGAGIVGQNHAQLRTLRGLEAGEAVSDHIFRAVKRHGDAQHLTDGHAQDLRFFFDENQLPPPSTVTPRKKPKSYQPPVLGTA